MKANETKTKTGAVGMRAMLATSTKAKAGALTGTANMKAVQGTKAMKAIEYYRKTRKYRIEYYMKPLSPIGPDGWKLIGFHWAKKVYEIWRRRVRR